jgi:Tol biopolymer transport system component
MPKKVAWPAVAALALLGGVAPQGGVPGSWRAIGAIQPRITADGRGIAYSYQGALWVMALAGGETRRLTREPGFDEHPAWSPDGKRIAYVRGGELRIMDPETGAPVPLGARVNAAGKLFSSPDGRRLLGNFGASLSWLDLQGGGVRPVLDPPRRATVFALSPDGSRIAYVTTQDVDGEQSGVNGPQADVWGVPAEGGAARRLFRFRSRIFDLWWSGGDLIAASDLGGAHNDLWSISLEDPTHAHRLTNGQGDEDSPSVSADGRWLVYTDNRESATALVVRDLNSGEDRTLPVTRLDFGSPTGTLRVELVEKGKGAPLTARVSIQEKGGKYFAPPGALYRMLGNVEHFYAAGKADLPVPAGTYTLRAFRGIEYREARQEVAVGAGETVTVRIELERWTDPAARGWWGGESHVHANYGYGQWYNTPATMRLQVEGEGLNLANMVVANSDTDGIFDREYFRGEPDPVSTKEHVLYWNEEFRATLWGHMTLYNLKHLVEPIMTGFRGTTNPWDVPTNADIADHTHLQGGHVNYTHPAQDPRDPFITAYSAKAMPVDVALGKIDSLDVNAGYEATVPLWYRLLNCGFRLPASAGTDVFLNRIRSRLPGSDRAYVKVEGPFSYGAWVRGLKAGRSFVTNGPMLEFSADGKSLGETVTLAAAGEVAIRARAEAAAPVGKVELVHNGRVLAAGTSSIDQAVRIDRSGWLSFRAYAGGTQAHTSPIYVEVAGKPAASREDAEYFLKWIDRLEEKLKARDRLPSPELAARVQGQLNSARAVYATVIGRAP